MSVVTVTPKPGENVLRMTFSPFVYAVNLKLQTATSSLCDYCLKKTEDASKLQRCADCHMIVYCDRSCQIKGWKGGHKYECKGISKLPAGTTPETSTRLIVRALIKLQEEGIYFDEFDGGKIRRTFNHLRRPIGRLKRGTEPFDTYVRELFMASALLKGRPVVAAAALDNLEIETLERIYSNSIPISGDQAFGVYLGGSIFEHSCDPMAVLTFKGPKMIVRNIKEIPKELPIDQVTVSHISNLVKPSKERKEELKKRYHFDCECERCRTGLFDKEMRSVICLKEGCFDIPCNAEIDTAELESPCPVCSNKLEEDEIESIRKAEKLIAAEGLNSGTPQSYLRILEEFNFSETHWLMVNLYSEAMSTCFEEKKFEESYQYGMKYLKGLRRYLHPNHPTVGKTLLKLARLSMSLGHKVEETETLMLQSKAVLEIGLDENSDFIKTHLNPLIEEIEEIKLDEEIRISLANL